LPCNNQLGVAGENVLKAPWYRTLLAALPVGKLTASLHEENLCAVAFVCCRENSPVSAFTQAKKAWHHNAARLGSGP
jgi:hypothetical protein